MVTLYFITAYSKCNPPIRVGAFESRAEAQRVFDACEELVKTIPKYISMDEVFEACKSWPMGSRTYLLYDFREAQIEEVEFEDANAANLEKLILTAVEWTENQLYRYDFYKKFKESLSLMDDERRRRED